MLSNYLDLLGKKRTKLEHLKVKSTNKSVTLKTF